MLNVLGHQGRALTQMFEPTLVEARVLGAQQTTSGRQLVIMLVLPELSPKPRSLRFVVFDLEEQRLLPQQEPSRLTQVGTTPRWVTEQGSG